MGEESSASYDFHWLTAERWDDLERLFGPRGACEGCWCMFWRMRGKAFENDSGEPNRLAFHDLVAAGTRPGILAYEQGAPVGWLAVAPRDDYVRLAHSNILAPVDDTPVWSITCFFVEKRHRNARLTLALLQAAVEMVKERGGRVLEGYPIEPQHGRMRDAYAYVGIASTFAKAGFHEAARRSPTRPIMRRELV